ncbi:hypothetical protein PVK71_15250 [Aliivibrio sp. S4MY1]|nr:hypothetical protein [Aliivibrio sp. S4MY1]MDD9203844.1 hypothetical protein [Aliivibrio sp. S4MY1]
MMEVQRVWTILVLLCREAASFNKAFKTDSQHSTFSIQAEFSVYGVMV